MTHLLYVPEPRTDFIFSAIGEELGFAGAAGFLALYALLIACLMASSLRARDLFSLLLGTGVTTLHAFHVLVNIGMSVGLVLVVGIPLPLVSHGGTAARITPRVPGRGGAGGGPMRRSEPVLEGADAFARLQAEPSQDGH